MTVNLTKKVAFNKAEWEKKFHLANPKSLGPSPLLLIDIILPPSYPMPQMFNDFFMQ